jgi:ribonucleotide monophosphatase NagD (HAD superfamily)
MTGINAGTKTILVKTGNPNIAAEKATFAANTLLEAVRFIEKS